MTYLKDLVILIQEMCMYDLPQGPHPGAVYDLPQGPRHPHTGAAYDLPQGPRHPHPGAAPAPLQLAGETHTDKMYY